MDRQQSGSRDTLHETFESLTPYEPEETPAIEQVATPPPAAPRQEHSKIKNTLSALASPFKTTKGFHIGPPKRGKLAEREEEGDRDKESVLEPAKKSKKASSEEALPEEAAEGEVEGALSGGEEKGKGKKKKKGARSRAGALVRKIGGSLRSGRRAAERVKAVGAAAAAEAAERRSSGSSSLTPTSVKRRTPDGEDGPASDPSFNDEYGSAENVDAPHPGDMSSPIESSPSTVGSPEAQAAATTTTAAVTAEPSADPLAAVDITAVATSHPVSTLPFAVSTWKPKSKSQEIERPIESPSPEDAHRRRITFVAQATVCLSEEREDEVDNLEPQPGPSTSPRLSRMVQLAREQRRSGGSPPASSGGSPSGSLEADSPGRGTPPRERFTDDEEFEDTAESHAQSHEGGMPPFGDLIEASDSHREDMGSGTSSQPAVLGSDRREHLYKILVIGELGTGKTSIIKRYVHQFFSQHYRATIGVDFALKVLNWDSNTTIRLQLWDIAGQERFGNMTRVYYKEAVGAFIVFDVTRVATFEAVVKWKQDLDSKVQLPDGSPIPCVLLANKCDQQKEGIINTPSKMEEYCRDKGFSGWFETSAKENINIEEAARSLVHKILLNDKLIQSSDSRDGDRIALDGRNGDTDAAGSSRSCPC